MEQLTLAIQVDFVKSTLASDANGSSWSGMRVPLEQPSDSSTMSVDDRMYQDGHGPSSRPAAVSDSDDAAMARVLQEEYNRETADLRNRQNGAGQRSSAPGAVPDYRSAGYQQNYAPNSEGIPAVCQVVCKMCPQVNPVPLTASEVQFRCSCCGFLNTFEPPIYRAGYGYGRSRLLPIPIFCSIQ